MEAKLGYNPNYVWRSIFASRDLVKAGARRRIVNGIDSKIWGCPWLQYPDQPYVQTPPLFEASKVTIDALFILGKLEWDSVLILDMFDDQDCEEILSIILPKTGIGDIWRWVWTPKGNYSVKSGYHLLRANANMVHGPSLTDWSVIWALKLPPKNYNFMWRVLNDNLPTKAALVRQ
ncbi:hypothetical protein LguiA_019672 [Lonicera macranthoides]